MKARSFRFRPPPVELSAEARWALVRAFAPPETAVPDSVDSIDAEEALRWCRRFGVLERCGHRIPANQLARELGEETAGIFRRGCQRAAVRTMMLHELAVRVAEHGRRLGFPVILLKGMALLELGVVSEGSRPMADLDVLVPRSEAERFASELVRAGFEQPGTESPDMHLPPLTYPGLGTLEIHLYLRGLHLGRARADAEGLIGRELCSPLEGRARGLAPSREVLATHIVAHAIAQHSHAPTSYPMLRCLADLQDLLGTGEALVAIARRTSFLHRSVSIRELDGLAELLRCLSSGTAPKKRSDPDRILRHIIAGVLDANYRQALQTQALTGALRRGDWDKIRRKTRRATKGTAGLRLLGPFRDAVGIGCAWLMTRIRTAFSSRHRAPLE